MTKVQIVLDEGVYIDCIAIYEIKIQVLTKRKCRKYVEMLMHASHGVF